MLTETKKTLFLQIESGWKFICFRSRGLHESEFTKHGKQNNDKAKREGKVKDKNPFLIYFSLKIGSLHR